MPTRPSPRSFDALFRYFLEARRAEGKSPSSEVNARIALDALFARLRRQGVRDVRAVSRAQVVSFARWLQGATGPGGEPLSFATRDSRLSLVRVFFAFLVKRRIVLTSPAEGVSLRREDRLPRRVLSEGEARRLMAAPLPSTPVGLRDRAILETLYGTGIRLSECVRLDLQDVDLSGGALFIRDGKGRRDRKVPLTGRAAVALDVYLREARPALGASGKEAAVFVSWRTAGRLTKAGVQIVVRRRGRLAGIPGPLGPHALRHSCATHLLRGGADVRHVQELLGHEHVQTTTVYTRVELKDLREVVERSHPREQTPKGKGHGKIGRSWRPRRRPSIPTS
jgi:integrase/recombinase XerD